ncbi:MAG: glycosyltransferase family 39 protein [Rhodospirillales bacterium]|jgi:4-amino-4-deoxy-L-arabinose transferase-like glycosyltransferase|nr:glycosyltransferase family 39 protein [Rhodospirillales bacterium]MDP6882587.1 glycosyltransferase family 39 protein [Rhodospirillales bacterium]
MIAALVVALEGACCVGLGAALLRGLGILADLKPGERACWSFAVGFGVLGWIVFFIGALGLLNQPVLFTVLVAGALGVLLLGRPLVAPLEVGRDAVFWSLAAVLCAVAAFDLMEGLAPPADADSLAYHFALPKQFLAAGRLEFIPRAVDGAVPLLVQMTYIPALGLGGETALTLWTMVSGWAAGALFYTVCRRYLGVTWSLAATLVLLTTPTVLYGAGNGQVETRMAMFVLVAALGVATALRGGPVRYALLAGVMAGFYMGSKYLGGVFVVAAGLTLLAGRGWLRRGAVFSAGAVLAGSQWYGWNWVHSGDPVFPLLFGWIEYTGPGYWDQSHADFLQDVFFGRETVVSRNPLWLLLYPFRATLMGDAVMESGRTGLGPFVLLMVPFAMAGVWTRRHRLGSSALAPIAVLVALHYALWFFTGSSQRVRHLLPLYPLLLLCVMAAAAAMRDRSAFWRPMIAVFAFTIALQLAGQAIFTMAYARHWLAGDSRDAFFEQNVTRYGLAKWLNANLSATDRVALGDRQLLYLLDVPAYFAHPVNQALLDLSPATAAPQRFYAQARRLGITHLAVRRSGNDAKDQPTFERLSGSLRQSGCAAPVKIVTARAFASRTLPDLAAGVATFDILTVTPQRCPFR